MSQKRGLGRGLGALLGDAPTTDVTTAPVRGFQQIPIARIRPNPNQPRTTFEPHALDELRASIAEFGVLVPIIVRPAPDGFELIAGERRWRAATAAQLTTIPAIVRNADERESLEVAIIENLQRENLDPLEEAMGFAHLIEAYGFTQDRVAQRLGRSRPAVANALRLLTLSDRIKALVRDGSISAGHARALLAFAPAQREALAQRIAHDGLSVRAVERLAQTSAAAPAKRTARATPDDRADTNDQAALLERLRYKFATHVALVTAERGGTIVLRYADADDLMRIADLLLGDDTA